MKERIVDVARRLFSQHSYLGVSMSDISKKLKITKPALYYHFAGKMEIYRAVLDDVSESVHSLIADALKEETVHGKLHKLMCNYLEFGMDEKNLINALVLRLSPADREQRRHIANLRKRVSDAVQRLVEEAVNTGGPTGEVDSRLLTRMLIGMADGLLLEHSVLSKKIDPKELSTQMLTVLALNGGH